MPWPKANWYSPPCQRSMGKSPWGSPSTWMAQRELPPTRTGAEGRTKVAASRSVSPHSSRSSTPRSSTPERSSTVRSAGRSAARRGRAGRRNAAAGGHRRRCEAAGAGATARGRDRGGGGHGRGGGGSVSARGPALGAGVPVPSGPGSGPGRPTAATDTARFTLSTGAGRPPARERARPRRLGRLHHDPQPAHGDLVAGVEHAAGHLLPVHEGPAGARHVDDGDGAVRRHLDDRVDARDALVVEHQVGRRRAARS